MRIEIDYLWILVINSEGIEVFINIFLLRSIYDIFVDL